MTYDDYKLETPEDEAIRKSGRGPRRGVYTITVERTITATITVEVEASCEDDAFSDAIIAARPIPLDKWEFTQDDYDIESGEGPAEPDPDDARDERMDREMER